MNPPDIRQSIERVLRAINAAITHLRLYADDHPVVTQIIEASYRELSRLLNAHGDITLMMIENEWVWKDQPLSSKGHPHGLLMKNLAKRGIESLTFRRGLRREDFLEFLKSMARSESEVIRKSAGISFGRLQLRSRSPEAPLTPQAEDRIGIFEEMRQKKFADLRTIYDQIERMKKIDIQGVDDVIRTFIKTFAHGVSPIRLLLDLRNADDYTYTHMVNVCILTMSQAESLGFQCPQLFDIGIASILHDAGKLFIPPEILNKPGRLSSEERWVMETHSAKGANFILSQKSIPRLAVLSALEHHIRYDGSGYPNISNGYRTNIVSQMITISDVFDAMRSRRPYKEPVSIEKILRILNDEKGGTFNPMLVDNFMQLLGRSAN
jgi:HD-GYP domain-containing protein (c-di-GMP phosphodiesterase class II)